MIHRKAYKKGFYKELENLGLPRQMVKQALYKEASGGVWGLISSMGREGAGLARDVVGSLLTTAIYGFPIVTLAGGASLALLRKRYLERHNERERAKKLLNKMIEEGEAKNAE